jgi:serine/threonine protein kinase
MPPSLTAVLAEYGIDIHREMIGAGGSAVVHQGRVVSRRDDGTLSLPLPGTPIAIKEFKPSLLAVPGQIERVKQEADIGKSLQHPNLVRTFGLIAPQDVRSDDRVLLLLEWVAGATLETWYRKRSSEATWDEIRGIALGLVAALEHLHSAGIFHRDIKPENVMVRSDGTAVLMDIGVAEVTGDNEHTLHTSVKDFVGSVRFASPQFILGTEPYTAADDVYSLGATLFLLFTGRMIYSEVERRPVLPIAVVNNPPHIESLQESVPASMKVLLEGCLSRNRERRPTLQQVRDSLENPKESAYITSELERQAKETRTYSVIEVLEDAASFLADLAGDTPQLGKTYEVVRATNRLMVPSYQREVVPEVWVAEAVLKHIHQNVGYFVVFGKQWEEGPSSLAMPFSPGQWVRAEMISRRVRSGDLVLKRRSDGT